VVGLLAPSLVLEAQDSGKIRRIGVLHGANPSLAAPLVEALKQRLLELGHVEGQNIALEVRWAHGSVDAMPGLAAELARLNVDVIVAGGTAVALACRDVTRTIPIIFTGVADPVAAKLVSSLAHPGGNVTGLSTANLDTIGKRLELLRDFVPRKVSRVAFVFDPADVSHRVGAREREAPARTLGIVLRPVDLRSRDDLEAQFTRLVSERVDGLYVPAGPLTNAHAKRIIELAAAHRLPAIYGSRLFVEAGGLMSYSTDFRDQYRGAATYVDKILRGARVADLPVELPTKFELVINRRTLKAMGLTIPESVRLRVDEIVE
jgi:putative tryptophan/tyrosine transport system substrate-binding protein